MYLKKKRICLVGYLFLAFLLLFNCINLKSVAADDVAVNVDDTIQWNFYSFGELDNIVIMEITNISYYGLLIVEGNITFASGGVIDSQGELLRGDPSFSVAGQGNMFGYGGFGLLTKPLNLSLLDAHLTNYTIEGNTITEVTGITTWQMTYNNDGILTVGKITIGGIENYKLSLISNLPPDGVISFGYGSFIILTIGIIALVILKKRVVKISP